MVIANGLLITDVAHARQRLARNAFVYRVYYLCFPLSRRTELKNPLFGLEKRGLYSFYEKDHGDGMQPLQDWVRQVLKGWDVPQADGEVVMLTMPRLLGYGFNPVSFYFCLDAQGQVRAVISEVNNTFGDRHCYISFHEDRRPISTQDVLCSQKLMHVSPYADVVGHYQFRFAYTEDKIGVWIDYYDQEGLALTTSMIGRRKPLSASNLLKCCLRYPLVTLQVIALIHYQALKLWAKGVRYRVRPAPPTTEISR